VAWGARLVRDCVELRQAGADFARSGAWFPEDVPVAEIARRLWVSTNAVYVWRRRWRAGGQENSPQPLLSSALPRPTFAFSQEDSKAVSPGSVSLISLARGEDWVRLMTLLW
jgi:transposase-like protein